MPESNFILLQGNADIERQLLSALSHASGHVHATRCMDQLREQIEKTRVNGVVVDMETVSLGEIEKFVRDFPGVTLVCNHRIADDELWTAAMNVGATDCCDSRDMRGILSALRTPRRLHAAA
jgi:hypothetical protein